MMRVVSGIQPTGNLHLGNYLGAIRRWVKMQDEAECLIFLADLHAITVYNDPAELRANVNGMAAALIACGIDPNKVVLFNHARVPAHPEMAWILSCTARIGWLNRMTQFKEKSGKNREGASVGLFAYPILQAADVLLYQATHVPVGEDQKQHVELTRDIAIKFNTDYGVDLFTLPEPQIGETAARIMSLRDGNAKMSKSDPSDMSRVNLDDSELPCWAPDGRTFLWSSEESGAWELELRGADGSRLRTLVPAALGYQGFVGLDRERSAAWVVASVDPRQRHVYRVPLDGATAERVTEVDGEHAVVQNEQGGAAVIVSRGADGKKRIVLDFSGIEYMNSSTFTPLVIPPPDAETCRFALSRMPAYGPPKT